jgi:hypothetical protein
MRSLEPQPVPPLITSSGTESEVTVTCILSRDPQHEMISPEIEEALNLRLQRSSYLALRNVHCICRNGAVVLKGCLPTHYLKQLLLEMVAEIADGYPIENEVGVTRPGHREPTGREGSGRTGPHAHGQSQRAGPGEGADRGNWTQPRD